MEDSNIHHCIVMWLDDNRWENDIEIINAETPKTMRKRVKKQLKEILANPEKCPVCGGLKYDLILESEGKQYVFALWKLLIKRIKIK